MFLLTSPKKLLSPLRKIAIMISCKHREASRLIIIQQSHNKQILNSCPRFLAILRWIILASKLSPQGAFHKSIQAQINNNSCTILLLWVLTNNKIHLLPLYNKLLDKHLTNNFHLVACTKILITTNRLVYLSLLIINHIITDCRLQLTDAQQLFPAIICIVRWVLLGKMSLILLLTTQLEPLLEEIRQKLPKT
jgi:hypothetical protein